MFITMNLRGLIGVLMLVTLISSTLTAADGQLNVFPDGNTVYEITEPGSYVLVTDVQMTQSGACIEITASNVTLDLNGHSIIGNGANDSIAILANGGPDNITIKDGIIQNFANGIFAGEGSQITGITMNGIEQQGLVTGENSIIQNNVLDGVGTAGDEQSAESGFRLGIFAGDNSIISNNTVSGVGGPATISASLVIGIGASRNSIVRDNTVESVSTGGASATGIYAVDNASGVLIENNTVRGIGVINGGTASFARAIAAGPGSIIKDCVVERIEGAGSASVHGIALSGTDASSPTEVGKVVGCVVRDLSIEEGELCGIRGGFNLSVSQSTISELTANSSNSTLYGIFGTTNLRVEDCLIQLTSGGDASYGIRGTGDMLAKGNYIGNSSNSLVYSGILAAGDNLVAEDNTIIDVSATNEVTGISGLQFASVNGNTIKKLNATTAIVSGIAAQEGASISNNEVSSLDGINLAGVRISRTLPEQPVITSSDETVKVYVSGNVINDLRVRVTAVPSAGDNIVAGIFSEVSCEITNNSISNLFGSNSPDIYGINVEANSSVILANKINTINAEGELGTNAEGIRVFSRNGACDQSYSYTAIEDNKITGLVADGELGYGILVNTANSVIKGNTIIANEPDSNSVGIASSCDTIITENYIYGVDNGYNLSFTMNEVTRQYIAGNVLIAKEEFLFFGTNSPNIIMGNVPYPNYFTTLPVNKKSEQITEETGEADE